jgi:hypothetical protein
MIKCSDLSGNSNLQNELLVEVLRRLGNRVGINKMLDASQNLMDNIKNLVTELGNSETKTWGGFHFLRA